jgi:hypothetical protein
MATGALNASLGNAGSVRRGGGGSGEPVSFEVVQTGRSCRAIPTQSTRDARIHIGRIMEGPRILLLVVKCSVEITSPG